MPLPTFTSLSTFYPAVSAESVKSLIGGNINMGWVTNCCVIRVSRALNYAGAPIPSGFPGLTTARGGDGKRYAFRVTEFVKYMTATYGEPDVKSTGSAKGFAGKTGIICFIVDEWSDASGHFDLWEHDGCLYNCYFESAREVMLWSC